MGSAADVGERVSSADAGAAAGYGRGVMAYMHVLAGR